MQDDYLGDDFALSSIPLARELNVGTSSVPVSVGIVTNVIPALDSCATVKELEESNWNIAMDLRDPA
jgi:hypothetical protein